MSRMMRFAVLAVSLTFFSQPAISEDLASRMAASEAETVAMKRCPVALADVNALQSMISELTKQTAGSNSKSDGLALACRSLSDLNDNSQKIIDDLKSCQAHGLINALAVIQRLKKRFESEKASQGLERRICSSQP